MNEDLQNKVWSVLPKKFKEEVKSIFTEYSNTKFSAVRSELMNIFGLDNLTSDSEGEEMLIVSRKRIQSLLNTCKECDERMACYSLLTIFGSKCLPDNVDDLEQKPEAENNIDLAKLNKKLDAALNSETKESLEEWMERCDDSNTRLQIAAQLLSGLLASGKEKHPVRRAIELTDALMEENKKR